MYTCLFINDLIILTISVYSGSGLLYILMHKRGHMRWIVVQVKSSCEDQAIQNLAESGFTCFCPKLTLRNGPKVMSKPLFHGYIFAKVDLDDVRRWRTINSHRGVYRILSAASGRPAVVPVGFVEKLQEQGELIQDAKPDVNYKKGEKILFTAGPLQGISGIIHWSNKERVALLVKLLGMDTIVQSSVQFIAPAEQP